MFIVHAELQFIMFLLSSEFYSEFDREMSIRCPDHYVNTCRSKNQNENILIQY